MVDAGHRAPLPDWVGYLIAAEEMNVSPVSFQSDPRSPDQAWWMHKALVWREAKAIARKRREAEQEAKNAAARNRASTPGGPRRR